MCNQGRWCILRLVGGLLYSRHLDQGASRLVSNDANNQVSIKKNRTYEKAPDKDQDNHNYGLLYHVIYNFNCAAKIGRLKSRGCKVFGKLCDGNGLRRVV